MPVSKSNIRFTSWNKGVVDAAVPRIVDVPGNDVLIARPRLRNHVDTQLPSIVHIWPNATIESVAGSPIPARKLRNPISATPPFGIVLNEEHQLIDLLRIGIEVIP